MRRRPNAWVALPSLLMGILAGGLAWVVTSLSCDLTDGTGGCVGWSVAWALIAFAVATVGTAIMLVLVYRSLAEWRDAREQGEEPPGPGCEI